MYIWGKGRAAGWVVLDFLSAIAGRVGSGQRFAGSGPRKVTRGQLCLEHVLTVTDTNSGGEKCYLESIISY